MKKNKQLRKKLLMSFLAVFFLSVVLPVGLCATPLSWGLFPDSQIVVEGQPFQLDLVVSGLGNGVSPSLKGFDVDITFSDVFSIDPSSVVFGTSLGDPNNATQTQTTASLIGPGVLFLRENSLLSLSTLEAIQGSSFILASMTFTGNASDTFLFTGDDFSGGLFLSDDTTVKPGITNAYVTVAPVPEPTTIILLGVGLFGLVRLRKNKFIKE